MAPLTLAQKLAKFGFPRSIISAFDKTVTYETNPVTGGITWSAAEFAAITPEAGKFYLVEA